MNVANIDKYINIKLSTLNDMWNKTSTINIAKYKYTLARSELTQYLSETKFNTGFFINSFTIQPKFRVCQNNYFLSYPSNTNVNNAHSC